MDGVPVERRRCDQRQAQLLDGECLAEPFGFASVELTPSVAELGRSPQR
jgi:hypothetical protein